jgi:hypothetical protein
MEIDENEIYVGQLDEFSMNQGYTISFDHEKFAQELKSKIELLKSQPLGAKTLGHC